MGQRTLWDPAATMCLIKARRQHDVEFRANKRTKQVWIKVSSYLRNNGHQFDHHQCHVKWKNLLRDFRQTKRENMSLQDGLQKEMTSGTNLYKMIDNFIELKDDSSDFQENDSKNSWDHTSSLQSDDGQQPPLLNRRPSITDNLAMPSNIRNFQTPPFIPQTSPPVGLPSPIQPSTTGITPNGPLPKISPLAAGIHTNNNIRPRKKPTKRLRPDIDQSSLSEDLIMSHAVSIPTASMSPQSASPNQRLFQRVSVHTRKRSPFKENIVVGHGMTFKDLLDYVFPHNPPDRKRFSVKTALENGSEFMPNQLIEAVLGSREYMDLWIDIEDEVVDYNELF
ncbi:365_t:CDS:2 [Paraglomus brasilianum]|uniref:365_t:CDS:1 n=1 Tax=Paraglomus brasilianum TaxID=144538 RepID=A0A9N9AU97_9GLOM|nr:365_t:CDS:2 [Paraglomus brasilianum]